MTERKLGAIYPNIQKKVIDNSYFGQFKGKDFWCEGGGNGIDCCFNHIIGLPEKHDKQIPITSYTMDFLDKLMNDKYVMVVKATGLGLSESFLRIIGWLCTRDNKLNRTTICIITGARHLLAMALLKRLKNMFDGHDFQGTMSSMELNGVTVATFPTNNLQSMRGIDRVSYTFIDEFDFFFKSHAKEALTLAERYIAKSNTRIALISTPNTPTGIMASMEKDKNHLYTIMRLNYEHGLIGNIFTPEEIEEAKKSPSFEREYNLSYSTSEGNVFPYILIDAVTQQYDFNLGKGYRVLALDPAFGSSEFGICGVQKKGEKYYITEATSFKRPDITTMLDLIQEKRKHYDKIVCDAARPEVIQGLRARDVPVEGISFAKYLNIMVTNTVEVVKKQDLIIHPSFEKLIDQLKVVEYDSRGYPDKKKVDFDIGDCLLMALHSVRMTGGSLSFAGQFGDKYFDEFEKANDGEFD